MGWHRKGRGGWPAAPPEVEEAEEAAVSFTGRGWALGFRSSPVDRKAIEDYAMALAEAHYRSQGREVRNVAAAASYGYLCRRPGCPDLHVEVKGTSSDGSGLLLTRNEVAHARGQFPNVALFVVSGIRLAEGTHAEVRILEPWRIDDGMLVPLAYEYGAPER